MNTRVKPIVALATGGISFIFLAGATAQAQVTLVSSGTATLADVYDTATGPEALTVTWFVVDNASSGVYTYSYNVNKPTGDVQLTYPGGQSTGIPETFSSFDLSFNASLPGAVLNMTVPQGGTVVNNGAAGLAWTFASVDPGNSSPLLAFQSSQPPTLSPASAGGGAIPPSPWSTIPAGQPVAAPRAVPEPATTLLFLTPLLFWPFSSNLRRFFGRA